MRLTLQAISTSISKTTIVEATQPKKAPTIKATELLDSLFAIPSSGNPEKN